MRKPENVLKQRELELMPHYLNQRAEESNFVKTPTVTIFEDDIKNGNEQVIEKFGVYNDTGCHVHKIAGLLGV